MTTENVFTVSLETFDELVISASDTQPILVDFWADWCSPCIVLAPIIEKVVNDYHGKIKLAKLEVDKDENMKLAGQYKVRGFPTVVLFMQGKEVARFSSAQSYQFIDEFVQTHASATL